MNTRVFFAFVCLFLFFNLSAIVNNIITNISLQCPFFFSSLGGMELLNPMINLVFNALKNCYTISFYISNTILLPPAKHKTSLFLHIFANLSISHFVNNGHPIECEVIFCCGIDLKFKAKNGEYANVFTDCLYLCLSFAGMFKPFVHVSVWLFVVIRSRLPRTEITTQKLY